jgi:VWFA-related protein
VAEVSVEARRADGTPAPDLPAGALRVEQAGEPRQVLALAREERPWRLVVYLDLELAAEPSVGRAARALEALAPRLVALGEVEVVLAADRLREASAPNRDAERVAAALARVGLMERGADRLAELRGAPGDGADALASAAAQTALVTGRLDLLLEGLAERVATEGPAAVLWVTDGWDLRPPGLAGEEAGAPGAAGGASGADEARRARATVETARALAALGWVVIPVALRDDEAPTESRWGTATTEDAAQQETRVLGRVRLPGREEPGAAEPEPEAAEAAGPPALPTAPLEPLAAFAAATGGRLVTAAGELPELVESLRDRLRVRYASPGAASGEVVPLAVTATVEGVRLVAPRWSGRGAPPALAALRARRLLAGELDPGEISVRAAVVAPDEGVAGSLARLEVRVEPVPGGGPVRLTLAALDAAGEPVVAHHEAVGEVVIGEDGPAWAWSGEVVVPAGADRVAVVAEDPAGGAWGGSLAGLLDLGDDEVGGDGPWDAAAGVLPSPRAVHLLRPEGSVLRGRVLFETVVSPRVARVELVLDGRRVATATAAPFAAEVDVGRLPLPRRLEAVAFDAAGVEVGRDALVVNGGAGSLRVRVTEPADGEAQGAVTVAAEVAVPEGRRLDRVELYWGERLLATLFRPPFRHRLQVPDGSEGILRAVAFLADGSRAEDAVYLNGQVPAERLDVALTELYVVVTDRRGRPVRGLSREAFTVREDGAVQRVESFGDASELPLTIGLALDSSASMFVKLPTVREAALGLLDGLVPGRDQAFLVEFDDEARLVAGPTLDLDRVRRAAATLDAGGRTSLWQGIVYSLVELQSSAGRRALVVYSDGADEDQEFSFRTCVAFARRVGVPVYVIVANDEAARVGSLDFGLPTFGSRLDRLTAATGGRSWIVRRRDDLTSIYAEIRTELAAQYRLGYYPDDAAEDGRWREVAVGVRGSGLQARTVAGYRR